MSSPSFTIRSKVTKFPGHAGWHFVWVDKRRSAVIKRLFGRPTGWGAVPVQVTLGATTWQTSIFYSRKDCRYLMGLKAEVRKNEGVVLGDTIRLAMRISL